MKNLTVYFLFILFCFSCNNEKQSKAIISHAEKAIKIYPDSVQYILSEIKFPERLNPSEKADYWRLSSLSHLLTNKAMTDDSLIVFSLQYYKEHHIVEYLSQSYQLAAMYYHWQENAVMYHKTLTEGLSFALESSDNINAARFLYLLGEEATKKKKYLQAVNHYKEVVVYDKNSKNDLYYLIGLSFANLGQKDSTGYYMDKSIELSLLRGDTISACHFLRNYADILYSWNKYAEALYLIKKTASYQQIPSTNLYTTTSGIYLMMQKYDSAQVYLDKAKEILHSDNSGYLISNYNSIISLQSTINYIKGENIDRTSIGRFNDSIWIDSQKKNLLIEEKINTKNQLERQNLMLTISKQRTQLFFITAILLIVICCGFIFFFIRNKRIELEEAEERREALQALLTEAMKSSNAQSENEHFFKKVLLQQLGLIRLIATSPTTQNQELLRQMSQITNKDIPTDLLLVWEDLYNTIDSIYDNFYTYILNKYGDNLNEKDIQLCCLLCAEFSTKEISVVTQQSVRTIYQRKTTIRQKLHMNEKDDIINFLRNNFK